MKNLLIVAATTLFLSPAGSADIFQQIWNLPESHVGVSRRGPHGQPIDSNAKVVVDEQGRGGKCLDDDHAPRRLLSHVDEAIFEQPSFKTFIALLNNYTAAQRRPEIDDQNPDHTHWKEVDAFLDVMFTTKPVRLAVRHIQTDLQPGISSQDIRAEAHRMWFQPFTNRYSRATEHCVGFEHVFVGEDESDTGSAPACEDRVGGYHSWVKFYLDESSGKANYLGYDYPGGILADALVDPHVTTIVMKWSPSIAEGSHGHDLLKKPGGFFVGTRPELEFAFGTLGMFAIRAGRFENIPGKEDHHRVRLGNNYVDLVLHPQSLAPPTGTQRATRGDHLRTMYPKFLGKSIPSNAGVATKVDVPTQPHNNAALRITRALPNPAGDDAQATEWVELRNVTEDTTLDLTNWRLSDQLGRSQPITGELGAGQTRRIELTRVGENSMMLKNATGWILLYQGANRRAAVKYLDPRSGVIIEF